ncbi:hypothetical protein CUC15_07000 [Oceanobacillus zhaokaii]|uniref:RsgI N-terminal anti-sigma domain-containing protein n=1 Tax=Oceanobacillus zhaokaii TaxID=2052660 RepID=A0A345PF94_9BACI|nr:hypothetical protein [Oceanobacillus zhaokaii]AXI08674.1 hypothetical protein CUC15_07000 [Oceanobacillus zhaokaii]
MKKGIVMERHQQFIILMTEEGEFEKGIALVKNPKIGEEVQYRPLKSKQRKPNFHLSKFNSPMKLLPMVSIILLLMLPFYLIPGNNETFAYVMIDINPSIELEVDGQYHVQNIRPLNKDAETIVEQLENVKDEKLEIIIDRIMSKSEQTGLINDEKNMLVGISFVDENADQTFSENLHQFSDEDVSDWNIATFIVPKNVRDEALVNNISMNKAMSETMNESNVDEAIIDEKEKMIINSFYHNEQKDKNPKLIEAAEEKEQVHIEEKTPSTDIEIDAENREFKVKATGEKAKEEKEKPIPNYEIKHNSNANHNSLNNNKVKEQKSKDKPNANQNDQSNQNKDMKVKQEKKNNQPNHQDSKKHKEKHEKKNQNNKVNIDKHKNKQYDEKNNENDHHHNDNNKN